MLSVTNFTVTTAQEDKPKTILRDISLDVAPGSITAIMGPNGSGKSTLVRTIAGDPAFAISKDSKILLDGKDITRLSPDQRAQKGIFLSFQTPPEIPGVTVRDLLRVSCVRDGVTALDIKKKIEHYATELQIPPELLSRSLNDGFSGGERKKMEVLQMAILEPQYIFLDEVDTGVDVDALKIIAQFLQNFIAKTDKSLVIITHANRILDYLTPHRVMVVNDGRIVAEGDAQLAQKIEKEGFDCVL